MAPRIQPFDVGVRRDKRMPPERPSKTAKIHAFARTKYSPSFHRLVPSPASRGHASEWSSTKNWKEPYLHRTRSCQRLPCCASGLWMPLVLVAELFLFPWAARRAVARRQQFSRVHWRMRRTEAHIASANINPSARTDNVRAKSRRDPCCPAASSNSSLSIRFTARRAWRRLPLLPMNRHQPASLLHLLSLLCNMNRRGLNPATRRHLSCKTVQGQK